jgi:hypothetical protein
MSVYRSPPSICWVMVADALAPLLTAKGGVRGASSRPLV